MAILIQMKTDFKKKLLPHITKNILQYKGSIHYKDLKVTNIYTCENRVPKDIKQTLTELRGEVENLTIIAGDFNTPLSKIDRTMRQTLDKETENSNSINRINLTVSVEQSTQLQNTDSSQA